MADGVLPVSCLSLLGFERLSLTSAPLTSHVHALRRSFLSSFTPLAHGYSKTPPAQFPATTALHDLAHERSIITHYAPNPSPNMSEQSDNPTGFFSLPRELRDKIYDMVREDRCKKD